MADEPYVGEFRWQGEPQNSPIELWDGKQWVLVGGSPPTDEELFDLAEKYADDNGLLGLHNAPGFARAVLSHWGSQ